jgi:hypothetical protein
MIIRFEHEQLEEEDQPVQCHDRCCPASAADHKSPERRSRVEEDKTVAWRSHRLGCLCC